MPLPVLIARFHGAPFVLAQIVMQHKREIAERTYAYTTLQNELNTLRLAMLQQTTGLGLLVLRRGRGCDFCSN